MRCDAIQKRYDRCGIAADSGEYVRDSSARQSIRRCADVSGENHLSNNKM